jgi:hypothetical protein
MLAVIEMIIVFNNVLGIISDIPMIKIIWVIAISRGRPGVFKKINVAAITKTKELISE